MCPQRIHIERGISYCDRARSEKMELYRPVTPGRQKHIAGVVVVHGGGWMSGGRADAREQSICQSLAELGYVCASIDYTLAMESYPSWPQALHDCKSAVRFLRQHAE